ICDDLDDGAIAERLGLSRNTVRNHVARIYAKIGVNRRSGAVVWGQARGMGSGR
ncbi:MAG: LuxR family transcriptional regulator, partial [Alphaproteobacteria bacterium]